MIEVKRGTCHCGEVEFDITIKEGLKNLRRCNCSLCRRKEIIVAAFKQLISEFFEVKTS
jgi:hypothetical protein